jgi:hypothetical protein
MSVKKSAVMGKQWAVSSGQWQSVNSNQQEQEKAALPLLFAVCCLLFAVYDFLAKI